MRVRLVTAARDLLSSRAMKTVLFSFVCLVGCAASDDSGPDFDDPDAKADGAAQPVGLYNVDGDNDAPYIEILDLRSDGTFYDFETGLADGGDGNTEEGVSTSFGTYSFTKDSHDNRFIRFSSDGHSWRWRFAPMSGSTASLRFYYDNGSAAFRMKRADPPAGTLMTALKSGYAAAAKSVAYTTPTDLDNGGPTTGGWDRSAPAEMRDRFDNLKAAHKTPKAFSFKIASTRLYSLEWSAGIEVFAENGQLIAAAKTVSPLTWSSLHP